MTRTDLQRGSIILFLGALLAAGFSVSAVGQPTAGQYYPPGSQVPASAQGVEQIGLNSLSSARCMVGETQANGGTCYVPLPGIFSGSPIYTQDNTVAAAITAASCASGCPVFPDNATDGTLVTGTAITANGATLALTPTQLQGFGSVLIQWPQAGTSTSFNVTQSDDNFTTSSTSVVWQINSTSSNSGIPNTGGTPATTSMYCVNIISKYLDVNVTFGSGTAQANAVLKRGYCPTSNVNLTALIPNNGGTNGGATAYTGAVAATPVTVKASSGAVYKVSLNNPNASLVYCGIYNSASPTVGTGFVLMFGLPANWAGSIDLSDFGVKFSSAITAACATTRTGNTAPGTSVDINVIYS